RPGLTVIADARKQSWHALTIDASGRPGPIARLAPHDLTAPLATPRGFRQWSPLPALPLEEIDYDVPALWSAAHDVELLRAANEPDAFLHEEPDYATWTPKIHQPPSLSR
ncbi:MAG TPA: peptidase M22, partial [Candidatus Synoicihabitans sp.]|nr:peptidase M22 [Candidatus Synoicihabitans sp.]